MPTPKTKQQPEAPTVAPSRPSRNKPASKIQLPKNMTLSESELANTARLVRLIRTPSYWLSHFIQYVLQKEAESTSDLTLKNVEDLLKDVKDLASWSGWVPKLAREYPHFATHPSVAVCLRSEEDDGAATWPNKEDEFYELVQLWRKEHPEPAKPTRQTIASQLRSDA